MAALPNTIQLFDHLQGDHRKVTQVMEQIEQAEAAERENLILLLNDELNEHMTLEEDFFYLRLEDFEELRDAIRQSYGEHEQIRALLEDVMDLRSGSTEWLAAFAGLRETKEDHVMMEEREIFPMAARLLSHDELLRLDEQMLGQKRVVFKEPPHKPPKLPPRAGL